MRDGGYRICSVEFPAACCVKLDLSFIDIPMLAAGWIVEIF